MGDIADFMLDGYDGEDDGMGRCDPTGYLHLSDAKLKQECSKARSAKIVSICSWPHKLSEKQRYCLAVWAAERDDREANREFKDKK